MARARNIKPGFFANEELVELPFAVRLLFIGLWTVADRAGRMEDKPKRIKMVLFPADDLDVDGALSSLEKSGFIQRYEAEGTRFIQILAFAKHQNPHKDEKASLIPAPCEHGAIAVPPPKAHPVNPADSLLLSPDPLPLIPDSGLLVTDTSLLIPDCKTNTLFGTPLAEAAPEPVKLVKIAKPPKEPAPSSEAWSAYAAAYLRRYGADPVRNATVNGQLSQMVSRIGSAEAPDVAAWYVQSRNSFYVQSGHSVGILLRDCEKLRTEWATGRQVTQTQAIQGDRTQTNANAFAGLLAEAKQNKETYHAEH